MTSERWPHLKRDSAPEFLKDLRLQLSEQLKSLDTRVDTQLAITSELQEYFRRRGEVEIDYGRSLEKLHRSLNQRHKDVRQKRDQIHMFSSYSCWQQLMASTRQESRDRAMLGKVMVNLVTPRLVRVSEDLHSIYKECRSISVESHEDMLNMLHELHVATKTYNTYYTQFNATEAKLQRFINEKAKLETNIPREKLEKSHKFRIMEKESMKRRNKYQESRVKAVCARNDLILSLEATNASVRRFFVDDISDVLDCMDSGLHAGLSRALTMACAATEATVGGMRRGLDRLHHTVDDLDSRLDKQKFIEANNTAFMLPKKLEFVAHKSDELPAGESHKYQVDPAFAEDSKRHYAVIGERIAALRVSTEEVWKTIEAAEKSLLEAVNDDFVNCTALFEQQQQLPPPPPSPLPCQSSSGPPTLHPTLSSDLVSTKQRSDRHETELFYMQKIHKYIGDCNMMARLQAKQQVMQAGMGDMTDTLSSPLSGADQTPGSGGGRGGAEKRVRTRRIGRLCANSVRSRLFGGSLLEYLETSGEAIPIVIQSCVRVINQYGLHHQGIFRVSGSQVEINNFRDSFERGDDPLADFTDVADINSVAGVLKLYLRELKEPLFPTLYFEQFMEIAQLNSSDEKAARVAEVVKTLPHPVVVVMRYLFAFLNHVSEFSDENMMDPYNLAICFGPTLLPIPDRDQLQYQALVNELVSQIILRHDQIFPSGDLDPGPFYDKYLSKRLDETDDLGDAPSEIVSTVDSASECGTPSEDDSVFKDRDISLEIFGKCEQLEALAQYDYSARSARELSFHCGDSLLLYRQISGDWWLGSLDGRDGLVPDKYVLLKLRGEDRPSVSEPASQSNSTIDRCSVSVQATPPTNIAPQTKSRSSAPSVLSRLPPSPLGAVSSRPLLKHSVSACDTAPPSPPLSGHAAGSSLKLNRLASCGADVVGRCNSGGVLDRGRAAVSLGEDRRTRCSSAECRSRLPLSTPETVDGAATCQQQQRHSAGPAVDGTDTTATGGGGGEDLEMDTRPLDRAMRQIELVTEKLRAAESECAAAAAEVSQGAEGGGGRRGGASSRPPAEPTVAAAVTSTPLAPGVTGERRLQHTVCSVWQTRADGPPLPLSATSAAAGSSVRSRRALWENMCSGAVGAGAGEGCAGSKGSHSTGVPATCSAAANGGAAGASAKAASLGSSLERSRSSSRDSIDSPTMAAASVLRVKKHTPDLVRDLPTSEAPAGASSGSDDEPVTIVTRPQPSQQEQQPPPPNGAEAFARQNQVTIRRGDCQAPPLPPLQQRISSSVSSAAAAASSGVSQQQQQRQQLPQPRLTRRPMVAVKPKLSPDRFRRRPDN